MTQKSIVVDTNDPAAVALRRCFDQYSDARECVVAFSGGADSTAQLIISQAVARTLVERKLKVRAIHVNHGLSPHTNRWAKHCQATCDELGIEMLLLTVDVHPGDGGVEAAAREARYRAFARQLKPRQLLLTAHHLHDQSETLLTMLTRGSGPAGLAAMPEGRPLGKGIHCRPWLQLAPDQFAHHAHAASRAPIDDPMNRDPARTRSYLRHEVLPLLRGRQPRVDRVLARVALNCADANGALDFFTGRWLQAHGADDRLDLSALATLPGSAQRACIRGWLASNGLEPTTRDQLDEIGAQIGARVDGHPEVRWSNSRVRRYRNHLYADRVDNALGPINDCSLELPSTRLTNGTTVSIPARPDLTSRSLKVRSRRGGEKILYNGRHRSLKKLFQEAGVAPWRRAAVPLIFSDDELVAVANWWLDDRFAEQLSALGVAIEIEWPTGRCQGPGEPVAGHSDKQS